MIDPTSNVSAPPPRYLLESDSSDEEGQGQYGVEGVRMPKLRISEPEVTIKPLGSDFSAPLRVQTAVVGVGQAGTYLLRSTGGRAKPLFSIEAEGRRLGTAVKLEDGALVIAVQDGTEWDVVRKILDTVQADKWWVSRPSAVVTAEWSKSRADDQDRRVNVPPSPLHSGGRREGRLACCARAAAHRGGGELHCAELCDWCCGGVLISGKCCRLSVAEGIQLR